MAINEMGFNQAATVLNSIVSQAKGSTAQTPTDTSSFVSLAKIGLETGYDALSTAISQVLSRTIFSVRPYSRKFKGLEADAIRYGNHVRKINWVDSDFEEDDRIKLADGYSIDPYTVKKPQVIQTNFYGENVFQRHVTIYRDQLDCAFSGPEEFARFISGTMQNVQDQIEQAKENMARMALANYIGGILLQNNAQIIHLITEYNAWSGSSITSADCFAPNIFPDFARFVYGRIATLSKMMEERTTLFHTNFTTGNIARHTPKADQRLFLLEHNMDQVATNVKAQTFNDEYLQTIPYEGVMFWQSIDKPGKINLDDASYITNTGTVAKNDIALDGIFGVLIDRETVGYTAVNEWSAPTPFNPRGGYYNDFYHFTVRYWNDYSENGIVLLLD